MELQREGQVFRYILRVTTSARRGSRSHQGHLGHRGLEEVPYGCVMGLVVGFLYQHRLQYRMLMGHRLGQAAIPWGGAFDREYGSCRGLGGIRETYRRAYNGKILPWLPE